MKQGAGWARVNYPIVSQHPSEHRSRDYVFGYKTLTTTLKAEIDPDAWASLHSDVSRPFDPPESGRMAVKVINHLGDEVMKVFRV